MKWIRINDHHYKWEGKLVTFNVTISSNRIVVRSKELLGTENPWSLTLEMANQMAKDSVVFRNFITDLTDEELAIVILAYILSIVANAVIITSNIRVVMWLENVVTELNGKEYNALPNILKLNR